jgi:flagellar secretion chaperone FliS
MDADAFLLQEIASSSPARLRFLLIQKAVGLCNVIEKQWQAQQQQSSVQWIIRVQDILSELLEGVQTNGNDLADTIGDLYVYLTQLWTTVARSFDSNALFNVREILEIEQITWATYVENENRLRLKSASRPASKVLVSTDHDSVGFDFQM